MTTPEQWLERLEAAERAGTGPPAQVGDRVWADIEARLANGPAPPELDSGPLLEDLGELGEQALGQAQAGAAGKAAGSSLTLKIVAAVAVTGLVAGGVALVLRERSSVEPSPATDTTVEAEDAAVPERLASPPPDLAEPRPTEPEPLPEVEVEPEPEPIVAREVEVEVEPAPTSPPPPKPEFAPEPSERPRGNAKPPPAEPKTLAEEVALMQALSTALKRGDSSEVLRLVAEHEREFSAGQLIEERRAAKARALCKSGKLAAGQKEAASFAARWPKSIHLAAVRQDCGLE